MTKEGEESITYQDAGDIDTVVGEKKGTVADVEDMKRMGKQQLFRVSPLLHATGAKADCISAQLLLPDYLWLCHDLDANMASASWVRSGLLIIEESALLIWNPRTLIFGLPNGGPAGLLYMYIAVVFLFMLVNISMAEMASMVRTLCGHIENHDLISTTGANCRYVLKRE
jgi:hypothetical protein